MTEVFDTVAGRSCAGPPDAVLPGLRPAAAAVGHARQRTVRELGGGLVTVRPDRARCAICRVTHVVLDAGLLPRRAYTAGLIGQALVAVARGTGTSSSRASLRSRPAPCAAGSGRLPTDQRIR